MRESLSAGPDPDRNRFSLSGTGAHAGKRNEPAYVMYTEQKIAGLKDMDELELAAQIQANFDRLFRAPESADSGQTL